MSMYYFIFLWAIIMYLVSQVIEFEGYTKVEGQWEYRWHIIAALILFAPIFYLAVFGNPSGDTPLYLSNFDTLPSTLSGIISRINAEESGKGFLVFEFIIKKIFGNNRTAFRVVLGLCHCLPVVMVYRKYSDDYMLSVFLFMSASLHIAWMMNGLRQFLAVAIIFAATPWLMKRKMIHMIAVILLASTIHTSAIIMIPIIFIVQGKAWNRKTIYYILGSIIAMYLFGKYTGLMDFLLSGTEYAGATSTWIELGDDGVSPIRVTINAIPMILSFIGRKYLDEDDTIMNICVNMSIITTGLYLIGMTTSGIMIGRLPIYTSLYNFILLPRLINRVMEEKSARFITVSALVLYFILYLIENGGMS